ncbi:MAG: TIGR03905 family TSCPD domain-containing protein [Spirochaetaceae bacterium]|jgi:uncharacterized protein (TIGR03905 family)|nr:TIGR03905 family TSCPD domain-containing protein [Spirochaetaceae bacterium]GMO18244.1 MAG: TIGR03905 family TSCPD domain-containing protein [Termitinemataceae bacterium]
MYKYETKGVCSSEIFFDIKEGKLYNVQFEGGCNGNLKALSLLVEGMDASEAVKKLKGINCGLRPTSCGDQLARAIEAALESA